MYEQWQGNEVGCYWGSLWVPMCGGVAHIQPAAEMLSTASPTNPAAIKQLCYFSDNRPSIHRHPPFCHTAHCATCLIPSYAPEVLLLGPLCNWPQLEVGHGLSGTTDRTNSGLPGVCRALHGTQPQPSVLDCQVRVLQISTTQQQAGKGNSRRFVHCAAPAVLRARVQPTALQKHQTIHDVQVSVVCMLLHSPGWHCCATACSRQLCPCRRSPHSHADCICGFGLLMLPQLHPASFLCQHTTDDVLQGPRHSAQAGTR